jgi:hypothetical protein
MAPRERTRHDPFSKQSFLFARQSLNQIRGHIAGKT